MNPHLSIGTTTDRINLLDENGILLKEWVPVEGGHDSTYVESSLGDYGQVISYRDTDVDERLTLVIKRTDQDTVIRMGQDLRRMLRTALNYWTDSWRSDFVYLKARAAGETNTRYAIIKDGEIPKDNNPFSLPFASCDPIMDDFELHITRGPWGDNIPGTGTAIKISSVETYDSKDYGNVDSAGAREPTSDPNEAFVAAKWNSANITHIFWWSAANAFSANLLGGGVPFDLFDTAGVAPQVNDYVLFGIDTSVADSGPFNSLVFDIGTAGSGYTAQWQVWTGAWVQLSGLTALQDNTDTDGLMTGDPFDTAGVKSVSWDIPAGWLTKAENGVTAYWVRVLIQTVPGPLVVPTQQNRDVYSVTWPYVEIGNTVVEGDIPSEAIIKARHQAPATFAKTILLGTRSTARGSSFRSYINAANEQNAAGITVTDEAGGVLTANVQTASGWKIVAANVPAAWTAVMLATISSTYAPDYRGAFRAFARVDQTSGAIGDIKFKIESQMFGDATISYANTFESDAVFTKTLDAHHLIDFGRVQFIPPETIQETESYAIRIYLYAYGNTTADIDIYDLVLIPVDEWAVDVTVPDWDSYIWKNTRDDAGVKGLYAYIDGITHPKKGLRAVVRAADDDLLYFPLTVSANSNTGIPARTATRIHFLPRSYNTTDDAYTSDFENLGSIGMWARNLYLSMRGDR